ncbi:2'-5' RNA ligase family protein [Curtobacterium sp. MCBD17_028]|uniref:2'-5' RNA ligase family protein n=1 Tax=Curtobacterium sp. MCBD17_028 TaxID=2175670 RepID=UPI000DA8AFD7|nr:2'-5' RNA ligase family protein [Curtobacterium sp. MCBD17_028]PZE23068.1 2'-5' RNA ligase family protein [Curtobacterium sp. MCBD17_028]
MRSIELVFDDATDGALRAGWRALVDAGLPSLALHDSPSNRPHVTLVAGPTLEPVPCLPAVAATHPAEVRFGGLTLFPAARGRFVLVRAVVVSEALGAFHRRVHEVVPGGLPTSLPDAWSPHVTIARRLPPEALPAAVSALAAVPVPEFGAVAGVRFWDGDERVVTPLTGV